MSKDNGTGKKNGHSLCPVERASQQAAVLEAFLAVGTLAEACRQAKVGYHRAYNWKCTDPEWAAKLQVLQEAVTDRVEKAILVRAVDGIEEYHLSQGLPVPDPENPGKYLKRRVYSDKLAEFYLRGRRRDVFGEKKEISGPEGGPVGVQLYLPSNDRSRIE